MNILSLTSKKKCRYGRNSISMSMAMVVGLFATMVSSQSYGTSLLQYLETHPTDKQRPIIHTFVYNEDPKILLEQDELIRIWAESWSDAGWNPVILTERDASAHPDFKQYILKLSAAKIPESRLNRFLRYISMSTIGGGWYSEPYILPIKSDLFIEKGFNLPNAGRFTMYEGSNQLPELLSGNKQEWDKLTFLMMNHPHNNDVMILHELFQDNPGVYVVEDSVVNGRYILDSKLKNELCDLLGNKLAAKFSYQIAYHSGVARSNFYEAVKSSLKSLQSTSNVPVMHTFFEPAYDNYNKLLDQVDGWKKAWADAGWKPVVLTMADAKRHPDFEKFENAFNNAEYKTSDYDRMCFYRWLAMAVSGGGWMSDYDTYPLYSNPLQDGLVLPNSGKLTSYTNHVPCFVSGSAKEWSRVSQLMLFSYTQHTKEFWSDMLALKEIQKSIHGTEYTMNTITAADPYKNDSNSLRGSGDAVMNPYDLKDRCTVTKGMRAIHFSHASCKDAGFCHQERGPAIARWIEAWKEQCLTQNIEEA